MHNRKRILIPIVIVVLLLSLGIWYLVQRVNGNGSGLSEASGTVEAVEMSISPELSGKVADVFVSEGDEVQAGDVLLRLDDELLQSKRQLAAAALEAARANLSAAQSGMESASASLRLAEANATSARASAQAEMIPAQQALDDLYQHHDLTLAQAEQAVAAANQLVRNAQYQVDNFSIPSSQQQYTAMEAVKAMETNLEKARNAFEPYRYESETNDTREDLKEALDEAQADLDSAIQRMENETALARALAMREKAFSDLEDVREGPDPDEVSKLKARIEAINAVPDQAEATIEQAKAGVSQAQAKLGQAQAAVSQAQAELDGLDIQIAKLTLYAPEAGVVLSRDVEAGEVIQPGAPVMTLGQLDDLKVTVYIPEDRYGQIQLGQPAMVIAASFPRQKFRAKVTRIADQAEFTPRNVQTSEGRRTTVYAVELSVVNPGGKLKPGMPVDVLFGSP